MSRNFAAQVILFILLAGTLCFTTSAFDIKDIQYHRGVFNEQENYTLLDPAVKIPESSYTFAGSNDLKVGDTALTLNRYPLVAYSGEKIDIEIKGFITDVPITFHSSLQNPQVSLNGNPVQGDTLMGSGTVAVSGYISSTAELNQPVSIISFSGADKEINAKFIVYTTNKEQAAAKASLFATSRKGDTFLFGVSNDDFRMAIDDFKAGNYALSRIRSDIAQEKSSIRTGGILTGLIIGAIIGVLVGWFFGKRQGQDTVRRPDLLALEDVIIRYFDLKTQRGATAGRRCEGILEKAFMVNSLRSELFTELRKSGKGIDPDVYTEKTIQPSFFQAFYEKNQFGHSSAFDNAIADLKECFDTSREKAERKKSQKPVMSLLRRH